MASQRLNGPRARTAWRMLLLGLAISSILLIVLARQLEGANWSRFWSILANLDGRVLVIPIAAWTASSLLRPWRWQMIFPKRQQPRFLSSFGALSAGNMANNILPLRGGDVLRCFLVETGTSLTRASMALATLGLEKLLDGFALLAILLFSFIFMSPPQWLGRLSLISAITFGCALAGAVVLHYRTRAFLEFVRSSFRLLRIDSLGDRIATLLEWFAQGLEAVSSPLLISELAVLTLLIWAADAVAIWGLALALQVSVSIPGAAIISAIVGLSLMIPSAPGFVGTYEFFSVAAIRLLGVEFAGAMALTVLMHAWSVLCTTIIGVAGLWACGANFSRLIHGHAEVPVGD